MNINSRPARIFLRTVPLLVLLAAATFSTGCGPSMSKGRSPAQVSSSHEWLDTAAKTNQVLMNASEIRFHQHYSDKKPLIILNQRSHTGMFSLLKEKTSVQSHQDGLKLDFISRFVILAKGKAYEVGYDHSMGIILGTTKEFGAVPLEVRDWLKKLVAASEKRNQKRK